jgi:hypothetical protein
MTTPAYQGANQPPADSGGNLLGRVGSFFGATTPMYASAPAVKTPDPAATAQKDASTVTPCTYSFDPSCPIDPAAIAAGQIAIVIPRGLVSAIDPAALAAGQIAIVVPRNLGCGDVDPSGT